MGIFGRSSSGGSSAGGTDWNAKKDKSGSKKKSADRPQNGWQKDATPPDDNEVKNLPAGSGVDEDSA